MNKEVTAEDKAMVIAFGTLRRKAESLLYDAGSLTKKVEDLRAEWNNSRRQRLSLEGMLAESMQMLEILSKSLGLFMDMRAALGESPDLHLAFVSAEASLKEYEQWLAKATLIQSLEGLNAHLEELEGLRHVDRETMTLKFGAESGDAVAGVIEPYKNREINRHKPVFVYRNLTRSGVVYSVAQAGEVVAHAQRLVLQDCKFEVRQAGRERYLRTQQRNVHAGVRGYLAEDRLSIPWSLATEVSYSPGATKFFSGADGQPVSRARLVLFDATGVRALEPEFLECAR